MRTFLLIWSGQLVSMTGSAMTRFALLTWAYQQTGEATTVALLGFFAFGTAVVFSPLGGIAADRFDRRLVMLAADLGAGLMTFLMLLLYLSGGLEIWHLFVMEGLTGIFETFQYPAYGAATSTLVDKSKYSRVSGLRTLAYNASRVIAPPLGGLVLSLSDIGTVMIVDLLTFSAAWLTLLFVRIPKPKRSTAGASATGGFWSEMTFGFRYIFARRGLGMLALVWVFINFVGSLTYLAVMPSMILARTGGDELSLATVQSVLGIAGVVGALAVSVWSLGRRKIHGVLLAGALSFLFGDFLMGTSQTLPMWVIGAFVSAFFIPIMMTSDRTIWQLKVPQDVQGRVFAAGGMLRESMMPLAFLVAGPLADRVFEPAMQPGGVLASVFGGLVGTGAGAGMGLMFVCTAVLGTIVCLGGYLFPALRNVETDLPDYVTQEVPAAVAVGGD
jgi:MFS transporter, DHA3 family, macrolide efflux protein